MKKREHTKTPFLLRLGCFSKIACIYKALHYQQRFQQFLLMILLLFAMLSVSISVSVFTRSDSIVARIDQMHATHTAIISDSPKGMYKFLDVIQKEEHCFDYYEKTSVYPYAPYPGSSIQGSFPLYIEGYVKSDANYPLLDGKPLEKLKGNEIAITQSYAKQLEDKGIQVLGHKEVIKDPSNGKTYSFVIASIMEYPNYNQGYIGQNDINKVDMFTIAKPAVAIGNYETIKKLEKASLYGNAMAKIRFHDYHEQDEYDLRSRMYLDYTYITGEMASYPDFRLLAEEMNANKIMNGIFQFVSLCVTICMLISSCFVLYAFMKRKIKFNVYEWGSPFEYPQCLFAGNRTNLFTGLYHSSYPSVYDAMVSACLEPLRFIIAVYIINERMALDHWQYTVIFSSLALSGNTAGTFLF